MSHVGSVDDQPAFIAKYFTTVDYAKGLSHLAADHRGPMPSLAQVGILANQTYSASIIKVSYISLVLLGVVCIESRRAAYPVPA